MVWRPRVSGSITALGNSTPDLIELSKSGHAPLTCGLKIDAQWSQNRCSIMSSSQRSNPIIKGGETNEEIPTKWAFLSISCDSHDLASATKVVTISAM